MLEMSSNILLRKSNTFGQCETGVIEFERGRPFDTWTLFVQSKRWPVDLAS